MRLIDLLDPARVIVPLEAEDLADAAMQLAESVVASNAATDAERFRELVRGAMPREVVSMGPAFLLHYRTDAVRRLVAAVGVSRTPLRRQEDSSKEARVIVLIAAPPKDSSVYLQAMSTFARALGRDDISPIFLDAEDSNDVLETAPLAELELPGYLTVRDVMTGRRLSVTPETSLGDAARIMVAHDVVALPVVSEDQEVLGMVTHRELLRHLLPLYVKRFSMGDRGRGGESGDTTDPHNTPVRDVMDRSVLCVSDDQLLADVATMMLNRNIGRFPVVHEGALVGFITRGDIVRRLLGR